MLVIKLCTYNVTMKKPLGFPCDRIAANVYVFFLTLKFKTKFYLKQSTKFNGF